MLRAGGPILFQDLLLIVVVLGVVVGRLVLGYNLSKEMELSMVWGKI